MKRSGPYVVLFIASLWMVAFHPTAALAADAPTREAALDALRRSTAFFHGKVSTHGGYVYRYSDDLSKREGEGKTGLDTIWVQPPGTPTVGLAYVDAYERTKEPALLRAAQDAGEALIQGQFRSGGWNAQVEFAPEARAKIAYRVDPPRKKTRFNVSTFDDDKTQSAIRFLVRLDQALAFKDQRVHEAVKVALDSVLKAQFPNGAWAQGWDVFPESAEHPVKPAAYPDSWPKQYPGGKYWFLYTFNDNTIADTIETLLLAARVYNEPRYRQSAMKAGDFILLAQMPAPQPAWAQQYNADMQPAWARKFEPPAVSGYESQGLLQILQRLYIESGDAKYLKPIPAALDYLKRSRLPDGRLARFYELRTNKPLYLTTAYELTFDDNDLPTHYGFKVPSKLEEIEKQFSRVSKMTDADRQAERDRLAAGKKGTPSASEIQAIISSLDARGAWVEDGTLKYHGKGDPTRRVIESKTFAHNVDVLSRYIAGK